MLVLSRNSKESVIIDGFNSPKRALKITVLEVKGRSVRLGFEVNADAPVSSSKTWEQILGGIGAGRGTGGPDGSVV